MIKYTVSILLKYKCITQVSCGHFYCMCIFEGISVCMLAAIMFIDTACVKELILMTLTKYYIENSVFIYCWWWVVITLYVVLLNMIFTKHKQVATIREGIFSK